MPSSNSNISTPTSKKRSRDGASDTSSPAARSIRSTRSSQRGATGNDDPTQQMDVDGAASVHSDELMPMPQTPSSVLRTPRSGILSSPAVSKMTSSDLNLSSPLHYGSPTSVSRTPRSGVRSTPVRLRMDINSERRVRQVQLGDLDEDGGITPRPESAQPTSDGVAPEPTGPQLVIWGTDVCVNTCKEQFRRFLKRFVDDEMAEDELQLGNTTEQPLYLQKMEEIHTLEEPYLNVNCAHLQQQVPELYRQLVCYPQEVIPVLDMAANDLYFERYPDSNLEHQIQVRPFNAEKTRDMRGLNPIDIDQLITISGMVIRTSGIIPEMREAFFRCHVCQDTTQSELDRGRIVEPTHCQRCSTNHSFTMVHNRCQFTDKQMVKLQEAPEDMPAGQTPHTIIMYAHNDLVDAVQAGDRITVTGIYRAQSLRVSAVQRSVKSVYRTYIDVIHFRKLDVHRLREEKEDDDLKLTDDRLDMIKRLSRLPDVYERLATAIAPSIYENQDIKKGLLLQLFGGTRKDFSSSGRGNFRSEINVLLCGDPGTSKSQLLQYVYKLVPRGQYTSGKGSSAVGLTAYITKDPDTKQLVLQSGALVLSDNGVCCIDEFDKMSDSTRSVLHEVMEQQTLSIAKAGIICQLNARVSLLAAANPIESQWNKNKTVVENIMLPPTLLSRFDLIFLILDPQDEAYDKRLARHLVSLYYKSRHEEEDEVLDQSVLRDYIAYAKHYIKPKLSEAAGNALVQNYVDMRQIGSGRGNISAYPRQLESLIRMAEAHAKVRLSEVVEVLDVEEAKRIHREAIKQSAMDPATGKIDISILTTGTSSASRKRRVDLVAALKKLIESKGRVTTLGVNAIFREIRDQSDVMITRDLFEEAMRDLQDEDYLTTVNKTTVRINV